MQQKSLPLRFNVIFWLLYFLYEWFGLAALSGDYRSYFINACLAFPLAFLMSYFTVHVLLKRYYDKWPKWKFWSMQILISVVLLLIKRCVNYYFIYPKFFPQALQIPFFSFGKLLVELVNAYLIVGVYSLFYFVQNWYEQRQHMQELMQENTTAELELLKQQVQPHFIFNMLNNIYSTTLKESPEAAKLISHLSSFLHYNLYHARQSFVTLSSELDYLKSYMELQQNRYGEKLDIAINVYDDINEIMIAPLLLLPLIENSFKHGIANATGKSWLRIDITKQSNKLVIKIENSIEDAIDEKQTDRGGLGLKNVERRLQLIYPNQHQFKVLKERYSFLAVLTIKLTND